MEEKTSLTDLGLELWILVYHLYCKYNNDPDAAFYELALRTRCVCSSDDLSVARSPSSLKSTQWYREMTTRHGALRQRIKESHSEVLQEAEAVTRSLYPAGCRLKEYADALQTCAAMLTVSIPGRAIARFSEYRVQELASHAIVTVTVDELLSDLIERPLLDAMTPSQWWKLDPTGDNPVLLKSVGLCAHPSQIHILCMCSGKLRCYRIYLDPILHKSGPTAQIAKRLARTHGTLLSEEQFRAYLVRLQSLMRQVAEDGDRGRTSSSTMNDLSHESAYPPLQYPQQELSSALAAAVDSGKGAKATHETLSAVNKADVGLLYRDPEAALDNVDLNDADDVTLQEFKAKMEERFLENALRPGDLGYEYDKRVEVKPTERSEWDDSD
ncbi:hypothetical protein TraAM80_05753 [Trypanosoma rangeli]|uniref:Centrosomal protein of 19 kDa n=1 Tax=Trypanosoma rangeli TaxID=5698 RepID=A0A3R7KC81_TRYRA|nr:uncharacterized protein TraAM80_05753 [Trypanosoma rangeli]RNF03593.1 hypothetical protein TraAM80_05753 [Trypanosoma rangeli]|eukprot:RNF03593.1 hypothetical protein TraAM80_05753 [Trypanosoma rangeli]